MDGKRPTVTSLHGVVAAAHPLAAQAGARLLASGGNAFDAAAATAAALNVVEPFMSGLAGLGYATCYVAAQKRVRVLDFVPPVPSKLPVERFTRREDLQRGALSVGTPGNLAGWAELGARARPEAAERCAAAGDRAGARRLRAGRVRRRRVQRADPAAAGPGRALRGLGAQLHWRRGVRRAAADHSPARPGAVPWKRSRAQGPGYLYGGALGEMIVAHLAKLGGCLTMADLEAVKPAWKEPLSASYRGLTVHTLPPPCEAFQFLLTLRILDGFDLARLERNGVEHLDTVWRAIRLAAGERIANNNFPTAATLAAPAVGRQRRAACEHASATASRSTGPTEQWTAPTAGAGRKEHHTTSFSIADREGNVICVTQSLGSPFGSGVVVPGTGLCLNNFLYWADINPASPNRTKPGRRAARVHGAHHLAARRQAGARAGHARQLRHPADAGAGPGPVPRLRPRRLQDAIEQPRARLWDGRLVEPEARIAPAVLDSSPGVATPSKRGDAWTMRVGGMQGVAIDPATGLMTGACDPRRDGYVATA